MFWASRIRIRIPNTGEHYYRWSDLKGSLVPLGGEEGQLCEAELEPLQQHANPLQILAPLLPLLINRGLLSLAQQTGPT